MTAQCCLFAYLLFIIHFRDSDFVTSGKIHCIVIVTDVAYCIQDESKVWVRNWTQDTFIGNKSNFLVRMFVHLLEIELGGGELKICNLKCHFMGLEFGRYVSIKNKNSVI